MVMCTNGMYLSWCNKYTWNMTEAKVFPTYHAAMSSALGVNEYAIGIIVEREFSYD
jgi:hypothetical protein